MYIYYKKAKFAIFSKRYTLLRKMAKHHGNVVHIANLLTSIEDKKL